MGAVTSEKSPAQRLLEALGPAVLNQTEVDAGQRPGTSSAEAQRIAELEREVRELRRANDILKAASIFFATELDGRPKK